MVIGRVRGVSERQGRGKPVPFGLPGRASPIEPPHRHPGVRSVRSNVTAVARREAVSHERFTCLARTVRR